MLLMATTALADNTITTATEPDRSLAAPTAEEVAGISMAENTSLNMTENTSLNMSGSTNIAMMTASAKKAAREKKYGGYLPLKEFEITPVPLVAFGLIAKANKKNFRSARNNFIPSYENHLDDYSQHFPVAVATILNFAGYEGRSNHWRYLTSAAASYATMAILVNGIKYTAKEMRPDGSTANSFPSGHTATAFVAATILHKEYGQTRSPWFSVGAYGCATMTGVMRTLNNRHWISDILVGAGLGVLSTDIGYAIGDLIWKDKGILRQKRQGMGDMLKNPSFFRFSLGMQFMNNIKMPTDIDFMTTQQLWSEPGAATLDDDYYDVQRHGNPFRIPDDFNASSPTYKNYITGSPSYDAGVTPTVKISTGTSVSAEGAYFINNYIGVGARGRITTAPAYAEGLYCYREINGTAQRLANSNSVSDVWSVADLNGGLFAALPLGPHHNIGLKALYGRRFFSSLDLVSAYDAEYRNQTTNETINATIYGDNLWIDSTSAEDFAVGLHYTYATNSGIALSAYVDYDYSKPEFHVEYAPYHTSVDKMMKTTSEFRYNQKMQSFNIGASMTVIF